MRNMLWVMALLISMLLGPTAYAAPTQQFVQQVDIVADNAVTPLDYSFFDQAAPGRIELYNVKNLWGAGAQMIFYVETDNGPDWLVLGFGGGMVEIKLQNKKIKN